MGERTGVRCIREYVDIVNLKYCTHIPTQHLHIDVYPGRV